MTGLITWEQAVAALDAIDTDDPEKAHSQADDILIVYAHREVAAAYHRVVERQQWWAGA